MSKAPDSESNSSIARRFIQSLMGFSASSWIQAAISILILPVTTRLYGTTEYGKLNMFVLAVTVCISIIRLSTEESYVRLYYEKDAAETGGSRKLLAQCLIVNLCAFALVYAIILTAGKRIGVGLFGESNPYVVYLCLPVAAVFLTLLDYQRIYFKMNNMPGLFLLLSILSVIANKLSLVAAALSEPTYVQAAKYMAATAVAAFFIVWIVKRPSFRPTALRTDRSMLREILRYSLPFMPVTVMSYANTAINSVLLKTYLSYSALAIYSATLSITNIMKVFGQGFSIIWGPYMFQNYREQEGFIKRVHSLLTLVLTIISLAIFAASDILLLILGKSYRSGGPIFALLILPHVLNIIGETTCYGIYINKKSYLNIIVALVSTLSVLAVGWLAIPRIGLLGAAVASVISSLLLFAVRTYLGQREYRSTEKFWRTIVSIILLLAGAVCSYVLCEQMLIKAAVMLALIATECWLYRKELKYLSPSKLKELFTGK